jgi:hypothetical protein
MMILATIGLLVLTLTDGVAHGNDRGKATLVIGNAKVSIDYGRPTLRGRDLMKMIHPGGVWRIGADAPTTLESNVDLDFGGTRVSKGRHILIARFIEPGKWSLVISSKPASQYEPDAKLAEVPLQLEQDKDPVEELSIHLSDKGDRGVIEIAWGTRRLLAGFAPAK